MSDAASALAPPFRLGPYEVRAKIAEGGMAIVYLARHVESGAMVAIKMIRDEFTRNEEFTTMFLDEARIVSRLRHPNIVRYFELGGSLEERGAVYLVMELLSGQSLWTTWDACRERHVRLRYDVIAWIGARVADGLHYAHELRDDAGRPLDIVHRDVNATNVFVTYEGEVRIIDFGLAKAANRASKTAAGIIKGKVAYMSPEQAVGAPVDRRTDVFALGTTLWELSCDRRLFKHSDEVETLKRVHAAEVPDPATLVAGYPRPLWRCLRRALARDNEQRYATAAEMARDLDACARLEGRAVDASTVAEVMRELFGEQRARDAAWVTEASAPAPKALGTLRPPSGFWQPHDAVDARPRRPPAHPVAAPPSLAPPVVPSQSQPLRSRGRVLMLAVAIVAAIAASVVIAWLAR